MTLPAVPPGTTPFWTLMAQRTLVAFGRACEALGHARIKQGAIVARGVTVRPRMPYVVEGGKQDRSGEEERLDD